MSTIGAGTESNSASDIGLIVQGTLILLSAIVAVCGYYVQGRLKSKERQREISDQRREAALQVRLETLRQKISIFVGPCVQHCLNIQTNFGYLTDWAKERYPTEHKLHMDEMEAKGFTGKRHWQGHWNKKYTIVGKGIEQIVKDEPNSELGRNYRRSMRCTVEKYAVPLADLINQHGQYLQHWGDKEAWKKKFPGSASNGLARNLFPTQMVRWTHEYLEILKAWDEKDFTDVFPVINPFPGNCIMQFTAMISDLREMENEAGYVRMLVCCFVVVSLLFRFVAGLICNFSFFFFFLFPVSCSIFYFVLSFRLANHSIIHANEENKEREAKRPVASDKKKSMKKAAGKYAVVAVSGAAVGGGIVAAAVDTASKMAT